MTRSFLLEILDLAEDQGWTYKPKSRNGQAGYVLVPPAAVRRADFDFVWVWDPKHESHDQKVIRDRLRKAGLKFNDEVHKTMPPQSQPQRAERSAPTPPTPVPENRFARLRAKVNETINCLGEIEKLIGEIETDSADMEKARDVLSRLFTK